MEYDGCMMNGDEVLEVLFTIKDPRIDYNYIPEMVGDFFVGENVEVHFKKKGRWYITLLQWDLTSLEHVVHTGFWEEKAREDRVYKLQRLVYKGKSIWRFRKISYKAKKFPNPFTLKSLRELDIQLDRRLIMPLFHLKQYHIYSVYHASSTV